MFVTSSIYISFSVDINKSLHLSMLHLHDTLDPGLAVSQASHMDPDCSIDNCVTFINGPVLVTLKLKYDITHISNDPWTEFAYAELNSVTVRFNFTHDTALLQHCSTVIMLTQDLRHLIQTCDKYFENKCFLC